MYIHGMTCASNIIMYQSTNKYFTETYILLGVSPDSIEIESYLVLNSSLTDISSIVARILDDADDEDLPDLVGTDDDSDD